MAPNVANLLAWPTTSGSASGGQHPNGRASEGWRPIMHDGLGQCPIKCDTGQRPIKRRRVNARIRLAIILFCLPHRWDTTSGAGSSGSDSISGHKFRQTRSITSGPVGTTHPGSGRAWPSRNPTAPNGPD